MNENHHNKYFADVQEEFMENEATKTTQNN